MTFQGNFLTQGPDSSLKNSEVKLPSIHILLLDYISITGMIMMIK